MSVRYCAVFCEYLIASQRFETAISRNTVLEISFRYTLNLMWLTLETAPESFCGLRGGLNGNALRASLEPLTSYNGEQRKRSCENLLQRQKIYIFEIPPDRLQGVRYKFIYPSNYRTVRSLGDSLTFPGKMKIKFSVVVFFFQMLDRDYLTAKSFI